MNENACRNTVKFIKDYRNDLMLIVFPIVIGVLVHFFTEINPFLAGGISFVLIIIVVYLVFFIKWNRRDKLGFLILSSFPEKNELKISMVSRNCFEKLETSMIIRRFSDENLDSLYIKDKRVFKEINIQNDPYSVNIAKVNDNNIFIHTNDEEIKEKIVSPYNEDVMLDKCEIVFELMGKTNEEYNFSELYKGQFQCLCTREPNIFNGNESEAIRSSEIKWIGNLQRWSEKQEIKRTEIRKSLFEQQKKLNEI